MVLSSLSSPTEKGSKLVAIVGNPNAGKTSLFNGLTGSSQKVGNYPGVTVERVSARLRFGELDVECVDVPGLYSLEPESEDERVASDVIRGQFGSTGKPDLLVCVIDASNLERNLYFYSQLVELRVPIVAALTMVDRVAKSGRSLDLARLTNLLDCEVVPVDGHRGKGFAALGEAIERNLAAPKVPVPHLGNLELDGKLAHLRERLGRLGLDLTTSELENRILDLDAGIMSLAEESEEIAELISEAEKLIGAARSKAFESVRARYDWAAMVQRATVPQPTEESQRPITDKIDRVLVHRVFGLAVFLVVMYGVFQSIYTFATPLMDLIEGGFGWLGDVVGGWLSGMPVLQSLVVDGLINGVGSALIFLPQILILFFFIAFLEGTGYLARAAFLMDKLLGWCGLNGRAFIPLLSSFACAIPGIMAARVMPDPKSRLATILVAPLMSCSARLPVYLLLIGAFIAPTYGPVWSGLALFGMHLLGLVVAVPVVWVLNRGVLKGKRLPFLLELPPYQWPRWKDVWLAMFLRGKVFLQTAGTIIVFMSIVIWALSYFPRSDEAAATYRQTYAAAHVGASEEEVERHVAERQLADSYLGRFGQAIEPVFIPAGFDWRITTGILSAFPARETVVSSLGIIFSLGGDVDEGSNDLRDAIKGATWPDGRPLLTPWSAVGLMGFFALCCQCMATLATVRRETNSWKWPVFMFVYMTGLAYIFAVTVNQFGKLL